MNTDIVSGVNVGRYGDTTERIIDMSLDWDIRNIPNHETLCWEKTDPDGGDGDDNFHLSPTTHTLIFTTIAVGMGKITADNVGEFHARQVVWARLHRFDSVPVEDVIAHIGLQTNVSMETRAQWMKRIVGGRLDDLVRGVERKLTEVDA